MTRSSSPRQSPKASPMASLFGATLRDDGDSSTVSARSRSRSIDSPHPPAVNALSSLTRRMAGEAKRMLSGHGAHSDGTLTKASLKKGAKKEKIAAARESFFCADVKEGTAKWTEDVAELQRVGNRSSGSSNSSGSSDKSSPWAMEHGIQTPSSAASSTPSSPKTEKVAYFAPRPEYPRAYSSMSVAPPKPLPDTPSSRQHRLLGSWLHEPDYEAPAVSFKRRSSECTLDLIQRENLASCITSGLSGVAEQDEALAHLGELLMNASPTATLRERRAKPPMHLPLQASTFTLSPPINRPRAKSLSSHRSPPPCPPPSTPLPALPFSAGLPTRIATSFSNGIRPPSPPRQREPIALPPTASPMTWPSPLFDTESLADEDFFDCPVPATPASICSSADLEGDAFYDSSMPATPANAACLLPISMAHEGAYNSATDEIASPAEKVIVGLGLDQESPGELMSALGLVFGSETMPTPIRDGVLATQPLIDVGSAVEYGFAM